MRVHLQRWPVIVVTFLLSIISFNIFFFIKAQSTYLGLVEDRPYKAALQYEKTVQRLAASNQLGLRFHVRMTDSRLSLVPAVNDPDFNFVFRDAKLELQTLSARVMESQTLQLSFNSDCVCFQLSELPDSQNLTLSYGSYRYELTVPVTFDGQQSEFYEVGTLIYSSNGLQTRRS